MADGRREQVFRLADGEALATVTAEGIAYVMRGARLRAVRVADGAELWQSAPLRGVPDAEPETTATSVRLAVGEQTVFYGYQVVIPPVQYTVVGALDASSGAHLWDWRGPERPLPLTGALSLQAARGNVYINTAAGISVFTGADGRLVWQTPGDGAISRTMLSIDRFISP
jgi:outer membrane protein assembly factor BamB